MSSISTSSTSTPSVMTSEEIADNLAKIGSEKLTAAVLNAERSDHLLACGRSQLLKLDNILGHSLRLGEFLRLAETSQPDLARKIALCISSITDEQERIELQRSQGEKELRRKFPRMADRIYTHGDEMEPPHQLKLWSMIICVPHARLIDVQDQYDSSTQIPVAYAAILKADDATVAIPESLMNSWERLDKMKAAGISSPFEYEEYLQGPEAHAKYLRSHGQNQSSLGQEGSENEDTY